MTQPISNETLKAILDANFAANKAMFDTTTATMNAHIALTQTQFAALQARFDKQDERTTKTDEIMTLRFKDLNNEISSTYMRKDMAETYLNRIEALETKPAGRVMIASLIGGVISTVILILNYLHIIPRP